MTIYLSKLPGGERGIRTPGGLTPSTVFETAPFDRSGISPSRTLAQASDLLRQHCEWCETAAFAGFDLMDGALDLA